MKKISGWVYIIIGAFVVLYTLFIQSRVDSPGMTIFFWVGIAFIGVGVFKVVSRIILGKDEPKSLVSEQVKQSMMSRIDINKDLSRVQNPEVYREKERIMREMQARQQPRQPAQPVQQQVKVCIGCNARNYSSSNFCMNCGRRLR